jgi:ABC-type dipeptide/oligopeptide/nickel transport system permease component
MVKYLFDKLIQAGITVLLVLVVVFIATRSTGSPEDIYVPLDATPEQYTAYIKGLGLDKPLPVQLWYFIKEAARGNLGISYATNQPVIRSVATRLPNTIRLALFTIVCTLLFAFCRGILSASLRRTILNRVYLFSFAVFQSIPNFFIIMLAMALFGVNLRWLPISGMSGGLKSYILPGVLMGFLMSNGMALMLRNSLIETQGEDYIKLARLKGLRERVVMLKHGLKNALIPVIGMSSMMIAYQLTGTIIVESMFAWPGIGLLTYQSIINRDYATVQGLVLIMTLIVVGINLLTDILYALVDPRIRRHQ